MKLVRLLAKRLLLGLFTVWLVLSGVFTLFMGTKNWHLEQIVAAAGNGGASASEIEAIRAEYLAERGLDQSFGELYVEWMINMFTFQWGESFQHGESALSMVLSGTAKTASYILPALVVASVLGLGVGLLSAMGKNRRGEGALRGLVYAGMGVPNFWAGGMILAVASGVGMVFDPVFLTGQGEGIPEMAVEQFPVLYEYVLPSLLVATTLLAAVASYARAYSLQYYSQDLTKFIRAKGGGRLDVARHVVRNAAVPLVSLLFTETLALIAISVFVVEAVFGIDGIGSLFYNAVWRQDLPILLGGTMVFVAVGVVGNILQDTLYALIDPRVDTDSL